MRALLIAVAIAAGIGAPGVQACSLPDGRLGETEAQATDRFYREYQEHLWRTSDVVFVGEVLSLRKSGDTFDVEVLPRGALKGEVGAAAIVYALDYDGLACNRLSFPAVTFPGLFYARRDPDRELRVVGMLNDVDIKNRTLRDRLYRQLGMEPIPPGLPDEAASRLPHWFWLAGTAGISLLGGFLIGRTRSTASNKQKPRQ